MSLYILLERNNKIFILYLYYSRLMYQGSDTDHSFGLVYVTKTMVEIKCVSFRN